MDCALLSSRSADVRVHQPHTGLAHCSSRKVGLEATGAQNEISLQHVR